MNKAIQLEASWLERLKSEFDQAYMQDLRHFLQQEKRQGKQIFPQTNEFFSALNHCPFEKVKVVILGQDPYHGINQAHGLSFSVNRGTAIPPSLVNIYKELHSDLGIQTPTHGNLQSWCEQGVLLLNSVLSVEAHKAASHQGKGWEIFTDKIIQLLNDEKDGLVFILWGSAARKKGSSIERAKHLVIESPHPSPLSAYRGFFGSKPFSQANSYLEKTQSSPIDWHIQ